MYISKNLRYLRFKYKLSTHQLAKICGTSHVQILRYEISDENILKTALGTVIKLAVFFEISLDDLIFKDITE